MPYALLLHSDQILTSSISNIDLVRGTCLLTVSRLEVVSFPSNALLWSLSSETTWVGSCVSGCSRVETRDMWMLPRDVTEKALLSSAGVEFVVLCCYAW